MKYMLALGMVALLLLPCTNAMSIDYEPKHPKKGSVVTVYATLDVNESGDVRLEYCIGDEFCSMPTPMKYENGKWVGNFTMPDAKEVEAKVLVNGDAVMSVNITAASEKTAGFEFSLLSIALIVFLVWRRRN
ncbi:MAG: hypothetical protein J7K47_00110 [Thermoplasmata archaeon]|nr:hypothetical protein [Thermoplasmata archaeon]